MSVSEEVREVPGVTGAAVESERTGDPTIAEAKVKEATAAISRLMRS